MKPLRTIADLVAAGMLDSQQAADLEPVAERYAVSISPEIARLIGAADRHGAIARQFLPSAAELQRAEGEHGDPIGDDAHSPVPGIVHRHPDRVLFKPALACPVYCRFCFRREHVGPGKETALSREAMEAAFAYIAAHREIWEVILTGGDPFILSPRRIADISARLSNIAHVKIVRWHTRVPVVAPSRVTDDLVAGLLAPRITTFVALHANHPDELSCDARMAIARLIDAGIPMVSQTVLLKGVNDDVETLGALMRGFVENRIKPYYLHHADRAPGTAHFHVPVERGQELMRELRARVSGLCVPEYVLDIPGGYAKARVSESDWSDGRVRDHEGVWHSYSEKFSDTPR